MISIDWRSQISEKKKKRKIGSPNFGSYNEVFRHLLDFGSYVFLEISYNDSLR